MSASTQAMQPPWQARHCLSMAPPMTTLSPSPPSPTSQGASQPAKHASSQNMMAIPHISSCGACLNLQAVSQYVHICVLCACCGAAPAYLICWNLAAVSPLLQWQTFLWLHAEASRSRAEPAADMCLCYISCRVSFTKAPCQRSGAKSGGGVIQVLERDHVRGGKPPVLQCPLQRH